MKTNTKNDTQKTLPCPMKGHSWESCSDACLHSVGDLRVPAALNYHNE